ncbi:MAG TPA: agmatinase, partial [Alphaproteobacteria bacterium]|nr:agmatinase [Alphaproteobacteria bacterium]
MAENRGDQAFLNSDATGTWLEMTYGGALSFARRRYSRDLDGVDIVVSGIPYDNAVTYRSGCRLGPRAIRAGSVQLAELEHFPFGFDPFNTLSVVDYGDAFIDPHHPTSVFDSIETHADHILDSGAMMLSLGGDHSVAYPLLKAHAKKHGPVALVQFDAHCDTWPDDGTRFDHGTMFARAAAEGIVDVKRSTQVGLRTYNSSDHGFEILTSPWVHRNGIDAAIDIVRERAGDAPVYLSFDIDGLDPAFAPGTGT